MRIAVSFEAHLLLVLGFQAALLAAPTGAGADEPEPEPLDSVGDYSWSDNIGLVGQGGERAEGAPEETGNLDATVPEELAPMQVPIVGETGVGYCTKESLLVAAMRAGDEWGPVGGMRMRCEPRDVTSLLTGWGHLELGVGGFPGAEAMLLRADFRMGLDVHVLRVPWAGFGPFVGYRFDGFVAMAEGEDGTISHGLEFGGHAIFRTPESPGTPPLFFGDLGMGQRFDFNNDLSGTVFELMAGVGGQLRFLVFLDTEIAGEFPSTSSPGSAWEGSTDARHEKAWKARDPGRGGDPRGGVVVRLRAAVRRRPDLRPELRDGPRSGGRPVAGLRPRGQGAGRTRGGGRLPGALGRDPRRARDRARAARGIAAHG